MEPLVPEVLREEKEIKDYQERRVILETWALEEYQVHRIVVSIRTCT